MPLARSSVASRRGKGEAARLKVLKWALICLLISLLAGAFCYTGLARGAGQLAKILFFIFLIIFIIILFFGDFRRPARVLARAT